MTLSPQHSRHGTLRAAHVSFHLDHEHRQPHALLDAWPTLTGVTSALVRAGVHTTIVQAAADDATIHRHGVEAVFVKDAPGVLARALGKSAVRAPQRMLEAVEAAKPDIVHVNGFQFPMAIRDLAGALPDTPVIVQDHASRPPVGWKRHAWRFATKRVAGVVFTVPEHAAAFRAVGAFGATTPVYHVLEGSSHFTPGDRALARAQVGMHGDPCLLWTGHLDANKDPLTVLAAFEQAANGLPDARLWCCFGKAPLLSEVRARIDQSPLLSQRVTLVGRRPHADMEMYFRAADLFVQGSHHEGCGYSIIEALACGTPPLVTDIPSSRRIVGDAGSLTPVGDVEALAKAIVEWSGGDRSAARATARARFERELSFDTIGIALRSVYERVLRDR
jgi:glycosyltransferase involved in cell wall biosynthesis